MTLECAAVIFGVLQELGHMLAVIGSPGLGYEVYLPFSTEDAAKALAPDLWRKGVARLRQYHYLTEIMWCVDSTRFGRPTLVFKEAKPEPVKPTLYVVGDKDNSVYYFEKDAAGVPINAGRIWDTNSRRWQEMQETYTFAASTFDQWEAALAYVTRNYGK